LPRYALLRIAENQIGWIRILNVFQTVLAPGVCLSAKGQQKRGRWEQDDVTHETVNRARGISL
jgi:hypothetical protein